MAMAMANAAPAYNTDPVHRLLQLRRLAERAVALAVVGLLAVLVALATAETVAWAFFDLAVGAAGEVQSVLLVWLALLSAAWGVAGRLHLGVDMVARRLPHRLERATARLAALAVAIFGALLAWNGGRLAATVVNTLPATGWPASVGYLPAVVGGALVAFFAVVEALADEPLADEPDR